MRKTKITGITLALSCLFLLTNCKKQSDSSLQEQAPNSNAQMNSVNALSVLFNGDASNGSSNVWKEINVEQNGTITTVNDETGTLCWSFNKPVGSHRAEGHGAKNYQAVEGSDIYIGWTSNINIPVSLKTEAIFQWKAYPTAKASANHPLMLRTSNGKLELQHFDENHVATVPWSIALSSGIWQKFVIHMKVSKDDTIGFIEFWYNGVQQTLSNGSKKLKCRTLDSDYCDPKWGVYGGDSSLVTHIVKKIRIASTYSDAAQ
ncbi:heparin lyase I family protein [Pedobacter sp. PAMC26386]|nr:heparin lyase I family protein [Pedobacter sp. PAMC26386]